MNYHVRKRGWGGVCLIEKSGGGGIKKMRREGGGEEVGEGGLRELLQ